MQFVLRTTPRDFEVPVGSVQVSRVLSGDVIQFIDYSHLLSGNTVSAAKQMTSSPYGSNQEPGSGVAGRFRLRATSNFGKIELTDQFHYDSQTGDTSPFWYVHHLRNQYYNNNETVKSIRRTIKSGTENSDRIISALIPSSGSYVIVQNSVSVEKTQGTSTGYLPYNEFTVSYGVGSVTIHSERTEAGAEFLIRYSLLPLDVRVVQTDNAFSRVEARNAAVTLCPICLGVGCASCYGRGNVPYEDYYLISVLSTTKTPITVKYRSVGDESTIEEIEEVTNASLVYEEVIEADRLESVDELMTSWEVDYTISRVFSRIEMEPGVESVHVTTDNTDSVFVFRPATEHSTHLRLVEPTTLGFIADWYPTVTTGTITGDVSVFSIPAVDEGQLITVSEQAVIIDESTLGLAGRNISAMYTHDGGWYGITATRGDGTALTVSNVDLENSIVYIEESVSRLDTVTVVYNTVPAGRTVDAVCLNPLDSHLYHNQNVRESVFLYVMAPFGTTEDVVPVYVKVLPKYEDAAPITYSYIEIDTALNSGTASVREAYRSDIINLPDDLKTGNLVRLEIIALIYVLTPLDEDGYLCEDARIFGGGVPERNRSFYDHSYFDGEAADMESHLVYRIPQRIKDDLVARAKLWNPDTVMADNPDTHAVSAATGLIMKKVKKFSQLGTTQEIVIE